MSDSKCPCGMCHCLICGNQMKPDEFSVELNRLNYERECASALGDEIITDLRDENQKLRTENEMMREALGIAVYYHEQLIAGWGGMFGNQSTSYEDDALENAPKASEDAIKKILSILKISEDELHDYYCLRGSEIVEDELRSEYAKLSKKDEK